MEYTQTNTVLIIIRGEKMNRSMEQVIELCVRIDYIYRYADHASIAHYFLNLSVMIDAYLHASKLTICVQK